MRFSRSLSVVACLALSALAACGGSDSSGPPKVASAAISALTSQLEVGETVQLNATAKDAKGNVLTGRTPSWSSSATSVATVDQSGVVTGVAPGSTTITLTIEGATASLGITVIPIPVAFVVIDNRTPSVREGGLLQLTASVQDSRGRSLPGRALAWSSSNATVATINNSGLVSALTPGSVYIRAESEAKKDSVLLRVRSLLAPTIATTSGSSTWVPGASVTITGTNFSTNASDDQVFISGVNAPVTAASTTALTVTVPAASSLPCSATGPVTVIVSVNGDSVNATASLRVATQRAALGIGESVLYTSPADISCNEFPVTGGTYLVTAFNTAPLITTRVSFQLVGASATPSTSAAVNLRAVPSNPITPSLGPLASREMPNTDRFVQGHLAALDANRALLQRKGNPHRTMQAMRARQRAAARVNPALRAALAPVPPPNVGDKMWKRMMKTFGHYDTFDSVRVRVVYVGPKLIILEDSLNPLAGTLDNEYQRIGTEFDTKMFKYLSYFGDPLAVDSLYDNNGRVYALFSQKVNNYSISGGSLLGFVTLCDFFPQTDSDPNNACPTSNEGEYFYAFVPNPNGTGSGQWSIESWRALVRSTMVHEMKHVVMYAERIARDASYTEETWLEEATAQQAAELWSRDMYGGHDWRADINWANGPRCDYAQVSASCPDPFEGIMHHFGFLYRAYSANENKTILTQSTVSPDLVIYGYSWSFARYVTDTYGGNDERTFLRSLVQQQDDRGINNILLRTGHTWAEMFGYFSLASLADNYPGGTINDARAKLPSWNTRDIFAEMSARLVTVDNAGNRTPAFPRVWPLNVRTPAFGNFLPATSNVAGLPGGGFAAWEISGAQTDPQVLGLRTLGGLTTPSNIGLGILRVK